MAKLDTVNIRGFKSIEKTAPSKRLVGIARGYDKVAWGVTAAADVTIPVLRAGCPWLDRSLTDIAALSGS
jgi:hypothetical protein